MLALIRALIALFVVELVFFVLISIYLRSLRREDLEEEWDARHPERAGDGVARAEFVRRAMVGYNRSLQARLPWLVFVLPTLAVIVIFWVVN